MDNISLKGENYIKSSKIASELGYTTDYVGQLCRSGQVDATLVGRTWYVSEKSIREHKKSRYRSTQAKSYSAIRKVFEEKKQQTPAVSVVNNSGYARYEEDTDPLLPIITKSDPIDQTVEEDYKEIEIIEAVPVKIRRESPKIYYTHRTSHYEEVHQVPPKVVFSPKRSSLEDRKEHPRSSATVSMISSAIIATGFLLMLIFIGMEQRFFASKVLPPETYYHFDLMGGAYAALEASKDIK